VTDVSTESVENPVEKIVQNRSTAYQLEQFSGLHHRSAIAYPIGVPLSSMSVQ